MSDDNSITIEINGQPIQAKPGSMIIEVADAAGIEIPRFCYHKKLSVAANCRMCMVEVEKAPKPLPACATPVADGMKIFTESETARDAQQGTMEFLLINHPLDCPICDQGGECELQDVALTYGNDVSRFSEAKRTVPDPDLGPLISTDMNRCIHCTRCVRFGEEIAGVRELGATGRGEFVKIGTFIEKSVDSELSGNVIDICPVGALTAKPSRFMYRPWELVEGKSIAAHDCVGSNVSVHVNKGKVTRVIPAENDAVNECWISDRDRFSYSGLSGSERVTTPQLKVKGEWQSISWERALDEAVERGRQYAANSGALVSPSATLEEMYLLQKFLRGIGVSSIDHRLRQTDFRNQVDAPLVPLLGSSLESLQQHDAILLLGSNVRKDQPVIGLKLRQAALAGTAVMAINPRDYAFYFDLQQQLIVSPDKMAGALLAVTEKTGVKIPSEISAIAAQPSEMTDAIAEQLANAKNALILLGPIAVNHPDQAILNALARLLGGGCKASLGYLPEGANATGAYLTGILPHRSVGGGAAAEVGKHVDDMIRQDCDSYWLFNIEPEFDCADPAAAVAAMQRADSVVVFTTHTTEAMLDYADLILPIAATHEKAGSMINIAGQTQRFSAVTKPPGEARSAWAILRMLGVTAELENFAYHDLAEVQAEMPDGIDSLPDSENLYTISGKLEPQLNHNGEQLQRYSETGIYTVDSITRRSRPLQKTTDAQDRIILSARDAEKLDIAAGDCVKVTQNGKTADIVAELSESLPAGSVCITAGGKAAAQLGAPYAAVQLEKVS